MNLHASPKLTPAEIALVQAYQVRRAELPGGPAVAGQRDAAIERIRSGLPTRRVEAWHYTDLRRLLSSVPDFDPNAAAAALPALIEGSTVLALRNGVAAELPTLPHGVAAERLSSRMMVAGDIADPAESPFDAIGDINAALVSDGYSIEVAANSAVENIVELQNLHGGGQVHGRFDVSLGAGASAMFVERQTGSGIALASSISTIDVADGADGTWILVQEQPDVATYLGRVEARLGKDAKLTLFVMNTGGKLVRQEINVVAAGENSVFTLRGINLLSGETHCDVTMVLDHLAYGASSTEIVRNVVNDRAHGVFQGQIRVARDAQKTDAKMACNTLLLSDEADFSTKPELEIFADDVACGHGATVTEIDRGHLFYLMARGISEAEARALLVKAFVAELVEELDNEALVAALEEKLERWFATHA